MTAFVEHEFEKGFALNEEHLRKISEIITSRVEAFIKEETPAQQETFDLIKRRLELFTTSKTSPSDEDIRALVERISFYIELDDESHKAITFKVHRGDYYFTTEKIEDVINEENFEWKKIEQIEVYSGKRKIFEVEIKFTREGRKSYERNRTLLRIEGKDRDFVYLLFSDLRQYISNEINVISGIPARIFQTLLNISSFLVLLLPLYIYIRWTGRNTPASLDRNQVLQSQDVIQKLNYLIQKDTVSGTSVLFVLAYVVIAFILFIYSVALISDLTAYLFPKYTFLFGKEISIYNRKLTLRRNIFWVVVVGSVISILTGLLVWGITR